MTNLTMLNFSSISLANTRVKFGLFALAYVFALVLYWPSFSGQPIWDDLLYWFHDQVMAKSFPYSEIWKNYTWPLSVSLQKILMAIGKENYWLYHLFNFTLHSVNAWLVYLILRKFNFSILLSYIGFVFFLIHPASVITVAWMIQFKTLICFTFAMGSLFLFLRGRNNLDYILSIFLFLISILSKSSSLPLPLFLLIVPGMSLRTKKALWIIPFFIISIGGFYRLTHSQVASEAIKTATKLSLTEKPAPTPIPTTTEPETFASPPDEPLVRETKEFAPENVTYEKPVKGEAPGDPTFSNEDDPKFISYARLIIKTLNYYFWQAIVPVDLSPVKGMNPFPPSYQDYLHLIFLMIFVAATWKIKILSAIVGAHFLLLPYLGIIPAPYMNVTWVSDQHLYLALPLFVFIVLKVLELLKPKWILTICSVFLIYFSVKTYESSKLYKDTFVFYESSIKSNFHNIPIVYNLSILYIMNRRSSEAVDLLDSIIEVSKEEKYIRENRYFPFLIDLHGQIKR